MKKFATLSLAAAAMLTLSACGGDGAGNNVTTIDNEIVLNSEEAPVDNFATEANTTDSLVADNSVEASNASVDANSTALNTAE